MDVTLQYFDDCPNWRVAAQHLCTLAGDFDDLHLEFQVIDTPDDAERYRFRGSPSILIDGFDPFADPDDPIGLSCRMYTTPDGPVGSPTLDELRAALAHRHGVGPRAELDPPGDPRSSTAEQRIRP